MMFGAKGSVKNRIYQFWLIRIWRERRKKRKEKKLLRKKRVEEKRKKVIEEVVGKKDRRKWKLSKASIVLQKKEGTRIQLSLMGKKPAKVVEVIEKKPKVGLGEKLEKKLTKIEVETTVIAKAKQDVKPLTPDDLGNKKKKLEQRSYKLERLQVKGPTIVKKNPNLLHIILKKNVKNKKPAKDAVALEEPITLDAKAEEKCQLDDNKNNKNKTKVSHQDNGPLNAIKLGAMVTMVAGGTLIAFPALLKRNLQNNKPDKKENNSRTVNIPIDKKANIGKEEPATKKENNELKEEKNSKLKLYRSKLKSSKEAEIIIKAELERQKNYLRRLNEEVGKVDVTRRVQYHFRGIHRLLEHVFTFTLGIFTIPFSRHRLFGTALGLTLIGNSIRGIRNSLKRTEEEQIYIEWKDFTKAIYSEQMALKQLNNMVIDSLSQIKGLKEDVERGFYGKVSFQEYEEMKTKLEAIELGLLEKQKQIEEMEAQLEKAEEKNKVKVKQMKEGPYQ